MPAKFFLKRRRKWPIRIRYNAKVVFIEIFNWLDRDLLIRIMDAMGQNCNAVVLSQFVNPKIWTPSGTSDLVAQSQVEYGSEIRYLCLLNEAEINAENRLMQIIVAGQLSYNLWRRFIHFGMNNLSNIVFGLNDLPDNWDKEVSRRNRIVVDWFNLRIGSDDPQFINLVNENEFIGLTIDGNLFFCFSRMDNLNRLLGIIEEISKRNNYVLDLSMLHISGRR